MKKMAVLAAILLLSLEPSPVISQSPDGEVDPVVQEWLLANALPISSLEPTSDYQDLLPLKDKIGDSRIVALGEATHGNHEFFVIKHRLIEFLVREMGFRVFALEANGPETERINTYVRTGQGTAQEVVAGMGFWTWNTQEMIELVEWMRSYNQQSGADDALSFVGFDAQNPFLAMDDIVSYLSSVNPEAVAVTEDSFSCLRKYEATPRVYTKLDFAEKQACAEAVTSVYDGLTSNSNHSRYLSTSTEEAYLAAVRDARTVVQSEDVWSGRSGVTVRDRYMAENVVWLAEQMYPDSKVIIWAHNGHIAGTQGVAFGNMGTRLHETYGDDMISIGLSFYAGRFNAYEGKITGQEVELGELQIWELPEAIPDSFEYVFHTLQLPVFLLDLRQLDIFEPGAKWFRSAHLIRGIGAIYDPEADPTSYYIQAILPSMFDMIIFIDQVSPSQIVAPLRNEN